MRRPKRIWSGPEPQLYGEMLVPGTHGAVFSGLWHTRQIKAWEHAWASCLVSAVQWHGDNLFTVPSQTTPDKWYVVRRYAMAPDGYLYLCDCPASEKGGVVCAHGMAVYLWRLRHRLGWRLKAPDGRTTDASAPRRSHQSAADVARPGDVRGVRAGGSR